MYIYIYMHKHLHGKIQCRRKLKDAHSVVGFLFRMLGLFLLTGEVPDPWFPTLAVVLLFEDSSTSVITSEIFSPFKWVEKCCMSCQRVFPQYKGSRLICLTHCGGSTASTESYPTQNTIAQLDHLLGGNYCSGINGKPELPSISSYLGE